MPKICKSQLAEVLPDLPPIALLNANELATVPPDDIFLCALGFEPRCLTLPNRLETTGYKARRAVYFTYATNFDDNAVNLPELERHLTGITRDVEPGDIDALEADDLDFPGRLRVLLDLVISDKRPELPMVTIDISVMANRLLLRCMKVLLDANIRVRVVYSEAEVYHPTKEEYDQDPDRWEATDLLGLERGVGDLMPSSDYPGHVLDPLPNYLILFPCFKAERSKAVIDDVGPSLITNPSGKVVWILGVPHLDDDRWRLEAMRKINGISEEDRQYEVCTFDYKETLRRLEYLHEEIAEHFKIVISPLGSKMQALGIALFCYMHPDVKVMISIPKEYNAAQYSNGCKATWKIDFGPMVDVRYNLDMVGTLRIEE